MTFLIILAAVLTVYSIAFLFRAAIYALPIGCGIAAALALHRLGWSYPAIVAAGFATGILLLAAARACAAYSASAAFRVTIALAFAGPATAAGYQAANGLMGLWLADGAALQILSAIAAMITAASAASAILSQRSGAFPSARPPR